MGASRIGFAIFEWALAPNWALRGEYLFMDFGGGDTLIIPGGAANSDFSIRIARGALNYRLGTW